MIRISLAIVFMHGIFLGSLIFMIITRFALYDEDIMSRQSLVSTMIGGWRMFKDDRENDDGR